MKKMTYTKLIKSIDEGKIEILAWAGDCALVHKNGNVCETLITFTAKEREDSNN